MKESTVRRTAKGVHHVLDEFLGDLSSRISKREFERLLFEKVGLDEVDVGYKPEAYTRFNLVEPLLRAVGLAYQLEPRTASVDRERWRDFEITNTRIGYVGEVKPTNGVEAGEAQIREYLGTGGVDSPYGFLTDGIDWRVYGPPADGGATPNSVSLSPSMKTVAATEGYWDGGRLSAEIRAEGPVAIERFPEVFYPDGIDTWALEKIPREHGREFTGGTRSLQASLDGVWESFPARRSAGSKSVHESRDGTGSKN